MSNLEATPPSVGTKFSQLVFGVLLLRVLLLESLLVTPELVPPLPLETHDKHGRLAQFGRFRYMSSQNTARKMPVKRYVERYGALARGKA